MALNAHMDRQGPTESEGKTHTLVLTWHFSTWSKRHQQVQGRTAHRGNIIMGHETV